MSVNNSSFTINQSLDCGRYVTANREFSVGEVIWEEEPLLYAPIGYSVVTCEKTGGYISLISCVGCSVRLTDVSLKCVCGCPVCSNVCRKELFHKRFECTLFKSLGRKLKLSELKSLQVIRACLMYKDRENSSDWQQFASLSSDLKPGTDYYKKYMIKEIESVSKVINDVYKLGVDVNIIAKILRTFSVNQFQIQGKDENGHLYDATVIYKTGSLFAHSCSPNAEWVVLPTDLYGKKGRNLRIYARRKILCNESINFAYIQNFLTSDTADRQKYMSENYDFLCRCERCMDPTEFNYFTGALKCPSCGDRTLLPDNSSDVCSSWTCRICGGCYDYSVMRSYVSAYEKNLVSILKHKKGSAERESGLELLINTSDERNLPVNHRSVIRTTYYWIKRQTMLDLLDHTMKSQQKFIKILERTTKCLKMFRMFAPLYDTVTLELVFAYAIASFYFKTKSFCSIEYDEYSPEEKIQIISAIYAHMKISVQIIMWNPYRLNYSSFRKLTFTRFKFWERQLQALTGVETTDIEGLDQMMPSYRISCNGNMNVWDKIKTSLGKFCAGLYQWTGIKDSDMITPDVSLLTQFDFDYTK